MMPSKSGRETISLLPALIQPHEANMKARPGEKPEAREHRVQATAESIRKNGQIQPVLVVKVVEDDVESYEYVDGGARVDAIAKLNEQAGADAEPLLVECVVVESSGDLFGTAVKANLHRTQNSLLEMAYICAEVRERHGWKGRGAGKQVAAYLGIAESKVSEYEKLLRAPDAVKKRIETGDVQTLDAALALLSSDIPDEKRGEVADRAVELAREEEEEREAAPKRKRKGNPTPEVPKPNFKKPNVPRVTKKHVKQAARETANVETAKSKDDILALFVALTVPPYGQAVQAFAKAFPDWVRGKVKQAEIEKLLDAAVGKSAKKPTAKPKKEKAVKPARPVSKPKSKKPAKPAKKK